MTRACALGAALAALAGCGNASLSELRPQANSGGFECLLTINFKKLPKGDPQDVQVAFSSIVLFEDLAFDWAYLAANDFTLVDQKDVFGNDVQKLVVDASTTDQTPPKLGSMPVKFGLPSRKEVQLKPGDEQQITATLFWGGTKQDSISRGLMMAYQTK